jgi:UDP-3-O-[3-hydroxymyristoyl] glucosamine N-acyltransferase
MIKLSIILKFLGTDVIKVHGVPDHVVIKHLKAPDQVDEHTLDWVNPSRPNQQQIAENSPARAILVAESVLYSATLKNQGKVLIVVDDPKLAIARVGNEFFLEKVTPRIDPSASVHQTAKIGKNIFIGPNACIGRCEIGDNAVIHANVVIYDGVKIGHNVIIKAGAVLGGEGFGFERDEHGNLVKFPQIGGLIIEDDVQIGANTCIDRGALTDTVIGHGTKINNLCHIAHNVVIGRNAIVTAQVNISGSTIVEDDVWISPNASLRGHQKIGRGATIGTGAVVTKDVPAGETWAGNPAKKLSV